MTSALERVWSRRPASAVAKLAGRPLLFLSARDLSTAAAQESALLVAFFAPAPSAMLGFARAARDANVPLVLVRPSGAADVRGPEEERDDAAFVEAALRAALELRFAGPVALLKEPPRAGSAVPDQERVQREIDAGFTGVGITALPDSAASARDAALAASTVCHLELGLEVVPLGGSPEVAAELARALRSRGTTPSMLRLSGHEESARELAAELGGVCISSTSETRVGELRGLGVQALFAAGPFLRALQRAVPGELVEKLQGWADDQSATLEQAAARHQRLLRDLPAAAQEKLEALCCFEAAELLARAGSLNTSSRLAARVSEMAAQEV